MELVLSDLGVVEKRLERLEKDRKKIKDPQPRPRIRTAGRGQGQNSKPASRCAPGSSAPTTEKRLRGFQFLSQKPILYVLNLGESDAGRLSAVEAEYRDKILRGKARAEVCGVCGKIEAELAELSPAEAAEYLSSYGLPGSSLDRLINVMYNLLGLMSFLTAGGRRSPRLDHSVALSRGEGRRRPSTPTSRRSSSAPRWSTGNTLSITTATAGCAKRAC